MDIDFATRCVDDITIIRDALVCLLRTARNDWRGNRRMGVDLAFMTLGGTDEDIRRTVETDIAEQTSAVTGFALDAVTATPPDDGSRMWPVTISGFVAGVPLAVTQILAV